METCVHYFFLNFLLSTLVTAQFEHSVVTGCPDQCSCIHLRSYSDYRSEYNSIDVQCNRYAAKSGANFSEVPDFRRIKAQGLPVKVAIELMDFLFLPAINFRGIKLQTLKLMNNPKLETIDEQLFYEQSYHFEELVLADLDSLVSLPYDALSELSQLRSLTLKASPKMPETLDFSMQNLQNLEVLTLDGKIFSNVLLELPFLQNLKQLQLLNIGSAILSLPPNALCHLDKLSLLSLGFNNLTDFPAAAFCLKRIHTLSLANNLIRVDSHMPAISQMPKSLQILDLRFNPSYSIPCEVFNLRDLKYFKSAHGTLCLHCKSDSARIQLARQHCGPSEQIPPRDVKRPSALPPALPTALRNLKAQAAPASSVRGHSTTQRMYSPPSNSSTRDLRRKIEPTAARISGFPVFNRTLPTSSRSSVTPVHYTPKFSNRSRNSVTTPPPISIRDNETSSNFSTTDEVVLEKSSNNLTVEHESNQLTPAVPEVAATQRPKKIVPVGYVNRNTVRPTTTSHLTTIKEENNEDETDKGNGKVPVVPIFLVNQNKSM